MLSTSSNTLEAQESPALYDLEQPLYQPLDPSKNEIRLLEIEPGLDDDALHCSLHVVSLDEKPTFETISYCWGDPKIPGSLVLNGKEITAPASSCAAVRRVRLPDRPRIVWIDALCIDQYNNEEKNHQVFNMDRIYSSGKCNLIHLGQVPREVAFRAVEALSIHRTLVILREKLPPKGHDELWKYGIASRDFDDKDPPRRERLNGLEALFSSPWFSRLWILQEVLLSVDNHCLFGDFEFPLSLVASFANTMAEAYLVRELGWNNEAGNHVYISGRFHDISKLWAAMGSMNAWTLISNLSYSSDPRDHLYGMLGLWKRGKSLQKLPALLQPSYERAVADIFRDATRYCLTTEDNDGVLLRTTFRAGDSEPSTTWACQFDRRCGIDGVNPFSDRRSEAVGPSKLCPNAQHPSLIIADTLDAQVLRVQGRLVCVVDEIVGCFGPFLNDNEVVDIVKDLIASVVNTVKRRLNPSASAEDVIRMAMKLLTCVAPPSIATVLERTNCLGCLLQHIEQHNALPPLSSHQPAGILHQMILGVFSRPLFTTKHGVGFGPPTMQVGDYVCVCTNASHPYILRANGDEFHYVGAAYMPEIMNGEVLEMGLEPLWIDLR